MTNEEFLAFGITSITACKPLPQTKESGEFTVEFAGISDRDSFKSYAPRLKPYNREAEIRLSLPDFHFSTFKRLEHEGYQLVCRRPGTKRSIKYDDISRSLVMDVKLPGMNYARIQPDQVLGARASKSEKEQQTPLVSEILAISAQELPEETGPSPVLDVIDEPDVEQKMKKRIFLMIILNLPLFLT